MWTVHPTSEGRQWTTTSSTSRVRTRWSREVSARATSRWSASVVNALAALAHRAQRRRGTLRLSTNDLLAVQGIRELVVERDPQTHDLIFTARYLDDEE